jgi:hypothetical protein
MQPSSPAAAIAARPSIACGPAAAAARRFGPARSRALQRPRAQAGTAQRPPLRRGPALSGSRSSRPRPGRNLGLGRESGHPPGPLLARLPSAVHVDRTALLSCRLNKTASRCLPCNPSLHFLPSPPALSPHTQQRCRGGDLHRRQGNGHVEARAGSSPPASFLSRALAASRRKPSKPAPQTRKHTEMVAPPPVPSPVRAPSERVDAPPSSGLVVVPFAAELDEENA